MSTIFAQPNFLTIPNIRYSVDNFPFDLPIDVSALIDDYMSDDRKRRILQKALIVDDDPSDDKIAELFQIALLLDIEELIPVLLVAKFDFIENLAVHIKELNENAFDGQFHLGVYGHTSKDLSENDIDEIKVYVSEIFLGVDKDLIEVDLL